AEADLRGEQVCPACGTAFYVAAAVVAARGDRPEHAAALLASAESSATLWRGGPWPAALDEARAERALCRGDGSQAPERPAAAHESFLANDRPGDAARVEARLAVVG